jgi:hypothetical protein
MKNEEQVMDSFKSALSIIERTLAGREVPFKIIGVYDDDDRGPHAKIDIEGERFFAAPTTSGTKVWIAGFPISNTEGTDIPPGFLGFSTDVAGTIARYYEEKPKGPFQKLTGIGTISLNEIIKEELAKVFEDYDFAAAEREYADKEYYEQDIEAEISAALSFLQDLQGSINNLKVQKELKSTEQEIDAHLEQSISHMKEAIQSYLSSLSRDVREKVVGRLGEINIEK